MARYYEVMRATVQRHDGTVAKFIGDAVVAVFGAPMVREDDAQRAVRCAASRLARNSTDWASPQAAKNALKAMGPTNLKTLQFTGSGSQPAQLMDGEVAAYCGLGRKSKDTTVISNGP